MAEWQNPETQAFWLAIQLIVLLLVVATLILLSRKYIKHKLEDAKKLADLKLAHQKELLKDSIQVQEKERKRFADDLHDDLLSKMSILGTYLHHEKAKAETQELLQECLQTARRISHDLSPPLLEYIDCVELLETVFEQMEMSYEIEKHISVQSQVELMPSIKLQLVRIVQEMFNNIIKHSSSKKISIYLRMTTKWLSIQVKDDGVGFDTTNISKGLGSSNIEMRIQMMGGHYKLKTNEGQGTMHLFSIPLKAE